MRIEPPWSPPIAMSTSPAATSAALPDDEPPADQPYLRGLCTGSGWLVWLPPDRQKHSQTALPTTSPPATARSWAGVGAFTAMVGLPEGRCGWSMRVGRQLGADMDGEGLGHDLLGGCYEPGDRRRVVMPVHRGAVGEALIGGKQLGPVG